MWRIPTFHFGIQMLLLSFLDKTNVIVTGLTAAAILYTRSVGFVYFATGAVLCSATVKMLKRAIQQPRPARLNQKVSYGMPSTHSATISFYGTYIPLSCYFLPVHPSLSAYWTARVAPLVVIPWATLVVCSRVWLGHHTWPQVSVGVLYGIIFAFGWFELWQRCFP